MSILYEFKCDACGFTNEYRIHCFESEDEYNNRRKKESKDIKNSIWRCVYGELLHKIITMFNRADISMSYDEEVLACGNCKNVGIIKCPQVYIRYKDFNMDINVNPICPTCKKKIHYWDGKYEENSKMKCPKCEKNAYWSEGMILCDFS